MARPPLLAAAVATERRPAAGATTAEDRRDDGREAREETGAAAAATATREEEALTEATGAARAEVERTAAQALEAVARTAIVGCGREEERAKFETRSRKRERGKA